MKKLFAILAAGVIYAVIAKGQTNSGDLNAAVSNLQSQLLALKAQLANTNPTPLISTVTFSNGIPVATNATPVASTNSAVTEVSNQVKPLVKALEGKYSWFASLVSWATLLAGALAPFRTLIRHSVANYFNSISEHATVQQDEYLKQIFGSGWYVLLSLVVSPWLTLPNLADLNRAIALQSEAVAKVLPPSIPAGQVATAAQVAAAPAKA